MTNIDFTKMIRLEIGKIACYPYCKQKRNAVELEISLYSGNNTYRKPEEEYFSICAIIWNSRRTDCVLCGQCMDIIAKYFGKGIDMKFKAPFNELMALYDKHYLKYTRCIPQEDLDRIKEVTYKLIELAN